MGREIVTKADVEPRVGTFVGEVIDADFDDPDYPEGTVVRLLVPNGTFVGHWYMRCERIEAEQ